MSSPFISFRCDSCQTEIEASPDMIGQTTECPACGARITIPDSKADDIVRRGVGDYDPDAIEAMKSRTIRIELGDL